MITLPAIALTLACTGGELLPPPGEPSAERITLVHSSRVDGDLEPCG